MGRRGEDEYESVHIIPGRGQDRPPVGQLGPQAWRDWPETKAVLRALMGDGTAARFVGGCVRDSLLKRPVNDVDIATPDHPQRVIEKLQAAGLKVYPTGIEHGTVTALVGEHTFEITTLRTDVQSFGRHADVAWTTDWRADAARRDFTINALSASPDGAVYDYFEGLEDLAHGRVRFIGRPDDRIQEDYLRILRFFRFYARFGRPPANALALSACRHLASHLVELSGERIRDEMLKILAEPSAAETLMLMVGEHILDAVLPEVRNFSRLRQVIFFETRGLHVEGVTVDPLRRLGAAMVGGADVAAALARRLRLSNEQMERLVGLSETSDAPTVAMSDAMVRGLLRRYGADKFRDLILLSWADKRTLDGRTHSAETARYIELLELAARWQAPAFPLRGQDMLDLGLTPGPQMGRLLKALEAAWEESGCTLDRAVLLTMARRLLDAP